MTAKQRHIWQAVVILLGFYPAFVFVLVYGLGRDSRLILTGNLFLVGLASFLGLLVSSFFLLFRHKTWWGLIALTFAFWAFFDLLFWTH
jgi:hypothetical protein